MRELSKRITAGVFLGALVLTLLSLPRAFACSVEAPSEVVRGGAAAFRLTGCAPGAEPSARFGGGEAIVYRVESGEGGEAITGLVAADLETPAGKHTLTVVVDDTVVMRGVTVKEGDYGVERITLPEGKVTLSEADLERVRSEGAVLEKVMSRSVPKPLWGEGGFSMPAEGRITGEFGEGRVLNGKPRSPHGGVDIGAGPGEPVRAAAPARVAFTGDYFFYGNFVVLDHGLGVFSLYSHLSEITVTEGEFIEGGEVVGRVGSTGRATGPHLHFAVRVGSARVSPESLFEAASRAR